MSNWSGLFPDGRCIFYEGDDPDGFRAEIKTKFGFDPAGSSPTQFQTGWHDDSCDCGKDYHWTAAEADAKHWTEQRQFYCPPEYLDEIYSSDRWPMGS